MTQITVDAGYAGAGAASITAYKVPNVFAVQDQSVDAFQLYTSLGSNAAMNYTFEATFNGVALTSSVLTWNTHDYEMEDILNELFADYCNGHYDCVVVTRGVDNVNNPGGFVYYIYFENPVFYQGIHSWTFSLDSTTISTWSAFVSMTQTATSTIHVPFTIDQIPLGTVSDSTVLAMFNGQSVSRVPIYKVSGNFWTVTFDTNLGDVNALVPNATKYLTQGTTLKVYDDVVEGEHPMHHVLTGLNTGIAYSARVASYTRGTYRGYSEFDTSVVASDYSDVPADIPPAVTSFTADETLKVNEVQEFIVSGSHLYEIQTITTSATPYQEVQEIVLTAPEGYVVRGDFAIRYPEVQTVQIRAYDTADMTGYFSLNYTSYSTDLTDANAVSRRTVCLPVTATADEVKYALQDLAAIDYVEVVRSGYGGYTDYFGYTWEISFVGNMVAGDVQQLTAAYGTSSQNCGTSSPDSLTIIVDTVNDGQAVGLDTEYQQLVISADTYFVDGQYQITFGLETSDCISWNATAAELESALKAMSNIDAVLVERSGDGSAASDFGFIYDVYFTGNRLHLQNNNYTDLPTLTPVIGGSSCTPFYYFYDGVRYEFDSTTSADVEVTLIRPRGFNVKHDVTPEWLLEELSIMPSFVKIDDVRKSIADDQHGSQWTFVYDLAMGNAPQLVCGMSQRLNSSTGICTHETIIQGNYIGGYFIVGTSKLMASDISAVEMTEELQLLTGFGNVSVSRVGPDNQGGYTWTVTWLTNPGDQLPLVFSNSLTGSGATVTGATVQDGNTLEGYYTLEYLSKVSSKIYVGASADEFKTAIQGLVGAVDVTRSELTTEGGAIYTVTFTGVAGDVATVTPQYMGTLTGVNAVVKAVETVKGSLALGTSLKVSFESPLYCSYSQVLVGNCGSPVIGYTIKVGDARGNTFQTIPLLADYSEQLVRIAAFDMYDPLYFVGEDASGYFKLAYDGESTGPISAHASAQDVRDAIESLSTVNTVSVSRTYSADLMDSTVSAVPGSEYLTCVGTCDFDVLTPGELIRVGGLWYKVAETYSGSKTTLPLASANDSSIVSYYKGAEDNSAALYRWARGFEWSVTFLSVAHTGRVMPMSSVKHGLNPASAAVSIRPADCVDCAYISGLSVLTKYYLKITAYNAIGEGAMASTTGTPKEIPGAPNSVKADSVSGTQLEVFFEPPTGVISDITQYTIQWDSTPLFTNVLTKSPSSSTSGYGIFEMYGAAINVVPPYRYLINFLEPNVTYYIRVAARNSVSFLTATSDSEVDPTKWSEIVSAVTADQRPSAPVSVVATVSGLTSLQVLITPPVSNGGLSLLTYLIEWDASAGFDDAATYGNTTQSVSDLPVLSNATGVLVFELTGLTTGLPYRVRVSAANSIGYGDSTMTSSSSTPAGKPLMPTSVSLTTASVQTTSITSTLVSWTAPSGGIPDGGSPITGYMVEWWQGGAVNEVQVIQFTSSYYPNIVNGQFKLAFGPAPLVVENTGSVNYTTDPYNIRSELMDLGYANGLTNNYDFNNIVGDVSVSRQLNGKIYQWYVTFLSETNQGDQVSLVATSNAPSSAGESVSVIEVVSGQRPGGFSEIQIVRITASNTLDSSVLGGWFRLQFNSTLHYTTYLQVNATAEEVAQALQQLDTMRTVTVTHRSITITTGDFGYAGIDNAGFEWTITFSGNVGNVPALVVDHDLLYTSTTSFDATVYDGDNALTSANYKSSYAFPGEAPQAYNTRTVGADVRNFTIPGLVPGNTYYVAVSAINSYGVGQRTVPDDESTTPPKQRPQPPTNVEIAVNPGSSSTLAVSYDAPISDGGSDILSYRIELDTTTDFKNPIFTTIPCAAANKHSVFQITTGGYASDAIKEGFFKLNVTSNRITYTTAPIPFDATATMAEESGINSTVASIKATVTDGSSTVTLDADPEEILFVGDRLRFDNQMYEQQIFTVTSVSTSPDQITLDSSVTLETGVTSTESAVYRILGGRGLTTSSYVACTYDDTLCPQSRLEISGSMESKFESLGALTKGVKVDRDKPDIYNGVTWRVTFLDDSLSGSSNFAVVVDTNSVLTEGGNAATLTVVQLVTGESYSSCTGTHIVPPDKALANGRPYYARVSAFNEIGYSDGQVSATAEKPQVVPGPPTSVALSVVSETALRVIFNAPADDGGDDITTYKVEYSTASNFASSTSLLVTSFVNAPFQKTITGLKTGIKYYVRVSAANSQGYGDTTASTPPFLNPYQAAGAPSNVKLRVTSDTMLTVSFGLPEDTGGDTIKSYRVEWDTSASFNGAIGAPNKGSIDLSADLHSSWTITYLTKGLSYYVRVSAINSAGPGKAALASSTPLAPSLQVPGKPQTILASTGSSAGTIYVSWQRPRIPWHGIPCSGTVTSPNECPTGVGGGLPVAFGGTDITEYEISYNDQEDFSGYDTGEITTTNLFYTLTGLIPDRTYYIRILARNAQGAGSFCQYTERNCLVVYTPVSATAKALASA